jgi:hypothetical protein
VNVELVIPIRDRGIAGALSSDEEEEEEQQQEEEGNDGEADPPPPGPPAAAPAADVPLVGPPFCTGQPAAPGGAKLFQGIVEGRTQRTLQGITEAYNSTAKDAKTKDAPKLTYVAVGNRRQQLWWRWWKRFLAAFSLLVAAVVNVIERGSRAFCAIRLRAFDETGLNTFQRAWKKRRMQSAAAATETAALQTRSGTTKNVLQIQECNSMTTISETGSVCRIKAPCAIPLVFLQDQSAHCLGRGLESREPHSKELFRPDTPFEHKVDISLSDRGPSNRKWARLRGPLMLLLGVYSIARWCVVHPIHKGFINVMGLVENGTFLGSMARFSLSIATGGAVTRLKKALYAFCRTVRIEPIENRPEWVPARVARWNDLMYTLEYDASGHRRRVRKGYEQWSNGLPSSPDLVYYASGPIAKETLWENMDKHVVDEFLVPGKPPLAPRHRFTRHEEAMSWHGRLCTWHGAGEQVFQSAVDSTVAFAPGAPAGQMGDDDEDAPLAAEVEDGAQILGENVGVGGEPLSYGARVRKTATKVYNEFIVKGGPLALILGRTVAGCWRTLCGCPNPPVRSRLLRFSVFKN